MRVRRRTDCTSSDIWTTRGRSISLFPRCATRPQRGPNEVLGACWSTKPAFSRGIQSKVDDSRGAAVVSCFSRRRRARQFFGPLGSSPWTVSGSFCVLGPGSFSLGCFWCFLRLSISVFLLKWLWDFLNLKVRVWGVPCLTGLGSLVPALSFLRPTDPTRSVLGWGGLFCLLV